MNLPYFRSKMRGNVKQKQQPSQHQIFAQTSTIRNLAENITADVMLKYQKWVSMIPNFWCSLEVAAAELHLGFVIKGNVWWKRTFPPMVTIVMLHHKHMMSFKPLYTTCYCVVRQKRF